MTELQREGWRSRVKDKKWTNVREDAGSCTETDQNPLKHPEGNKLGKENER